MISAEEFLSRTMPVTECGCWIWMQGCDGHGYGGITIDGRQRHTHRVAWELFRGPIDGLHVLHRCDIPCCVNPDHLFLGTHAENMRDKTRKGRSARTFGTHNRSAKLNPAAVIAIRNSNSTVTELAQEYGVSIAVISKVRRGVTWQAVGGPRTFYRKLVHVGATA